MQWVDRINRSMIQSQKTVHDSMQPFRKMLDHNMIGSTSVNANYLYLEVSPVQ